MQCKNVDLRFLHKFWQKNAELKFFDKDKQVRQLLISSVNGFDSFLSTTSIVTAEKMRFSIKDFLSKSDQIRSFLVISLWQSLVTFRVSWGSPLRKKWSFPLRIPSVNVTKSAVCYGFGYIYCRNPSWKTSFLCSV